MRQISFVQLSDLHIGRRLLDNTFHKKWSLFSGYNPHDGNLFESVQNTLAEIRHKYVPVENKLRVVMSGDLTAGGTPNDYAMAWGVMRRRWQYVAPPNQREIGFSFPDDRDSLLMIPGNHDHWGSDHYQTGYRADVARDHFMETPWRQQWGSPDGKLILDLYGIDSNSGMRPNRNLLAGGCLSSRERHTLLDHLKEGMEEAKGDAGSGVIRVKAFVCHHAFTVGSGKIPLPLDLSSQEWLKFHAARYRVSAVLTGHTHEFEQINWLHPYSDDPNWNLRELRCAAATAGPAEPLGNGFYFHQIKLEDGQAQPTWRAWRYQTGRPLEFAREAKPFVDFVVVP